MSTTLTPLRPLDIAGTTKLLLRTNEVCGFNFKSKSNKECAGGVGALMYSALGYTKRRKIGNGFWAWKNVQKLGWGVIYTGMLSNSTTDADFKASGIGKWQPGDVCCMITQNHLNWGKKFDKAWSKYFSFETALSAPIEFQGKMGHYVDSDTGVQHDIGHIAIFMNDGHWWSDFRQAHGFGVYGKPLFVVYLRYGNVNKVDTNQFDSSKLWGSEERISVGKVKKKGMGGHFTGKKINKLTKPRKTVAKTEKVTKVVRDLNRTTWDDVIMGDFTVSKVMEEASETDITFGPGLSTDDEEQTSEGFLDSLKPNPDYTTGLTTLSAVATDILQSGNFSPQGMLQLAPGVPVWSTTCPVCHNKVNYLPPGGVCSKDCALKLLEQKLAGAFLPMETEAGEYTKKIKAIADMLEIVANLISTIPDLIEELYELPQLYRNYVLVKVNWVFAYIQYFMNKLLIWKNKLIIKLLSSIKNGVISHFIGGIFTFVNQILLLVQFLLDCLDKGYGAVYKVITEGMPMFRIEPEEMGFFLTPRSFIGSNPGRFFVPIPNMANAAASSTDCVNMDALTKLINFSFPKITEPEYFIEPELFDIRLVFSDQNYKMIFNLLEPLLRVVTFGAELLPEYKQLVPWNPWYMLALLGEVCPTTRDIYGMPMYP